MRKQLIDRGVERICEKGCQSVRGDIRAREAVLKELRSIMAVYGECCPADRRVKKA